MSSQPHNIQLIFFFRFLSSWCSGSSATAFRLGCFFVGFLFPTRGPDTEVSEAVSVSESNFELDESSMSSGVRSPSSSSRRFASRCQWPKISSYSLARG
jgi:hypothetical protein